MEHTPTELSQFPIGSFRDFVRTDTQTRSRQKQYLLADSIMNLSFLKIAKTKTEARGQQHCP